MRINVLHMKISVLYTVIVINLIFFSFSARNVFCEDWQKSLEQVFDIVDTFDNLQDWHGTSTGDINLSSQMPKKLDGTPSIWNRYTSTDTAKDNWICNHGTGYVWSGTKSLCINYNNISSDISDTAEVLGYGPSRMSTFFGDGVSGKSGYKEIHVFYMIKFRQGFFIKNTSNTGWAYTNGYLKTLEICSGFTAVSTWGTPTERSLVCNTEQILSEYGPQYSILNITGGGSSLSSKLCFQDSPRRAYFTGSCWSNNTNDLNIYTGANIADEYANDKWVGVEIISDIGTLNNADGYLVIKIYNDHGVLIGTDSRTNQSRLIKFDHLYNKVTIGGNKCFSQPCGTENRFYIDDFIINKTEIAPLYFKYLSGQCIPGIKPAKPILKLL